MRVSTFHLLIPLILIHWLGNIKKVMQGGAQTEGREAARILGSGKKILMMRKRKEIEHPCE